MQCPLPLILSALQRHSSSSWLVATTGTQGYCSTVDGPTCCVMRGGCSRHQGDTNGLWAPEDVALAGSVLSDLCIATAGSTSTTTQWQLPQGYGLSVVLPAWREPQLPSHSTAAHGSGITAIL